MVRPRKPRITKLDPKTIYFKPRAVPLSELKEVEIERDELEALCLCDYKALGQKDASLKMGVSQSAIQGILARARNKVAESLCEGKAIKIKKL